VFKKGETSAADMMQLFTDTSKVGDKIEPPPVPPVKLAALLELSSSLRPNVEAYETNIDGKGFRFEPAIDFNAPSAVDAVRDAIFVQGLISAQDRRQELDDVPEPTDEEVEEKIKSLQREARLELARLTSFFTSCNPDGTFIDLRRETRQDIEMTGNGYWEVLRSSEGTSRGIPRHLVRVPAITMRIARGPLDQVTVRERRRLTALSWETVNVKRQFKRFAQVDPDSDKIIVWFKEFGDPRLMSRQTGAFFPDGDAMLLEEGPDALPATEIMHFSIKSGVSVYGLPRWLGNLPAVLGSRELDETNLDYFLSNAVPAMAILVAGGRLGKGASERLKEFFEEEVRGRRATHKLVVLEAETQRRSAQGPSQLPRIEIVPLRNAQVQDGLFQVYDERNISKIGTSFRLPPSVTGGDQANLADLRFAEDQVYQPERESFDARLNKFLFPELKVEFWEFKSRGPTTRDPEAMGKLALQFGKEGFLVPAEVRRIIEDIFNRDLPTIVGVWASQPMNLTLAALGIKAGPAEAVREQTRQEGDEPAMDPLQRELGLDPATASVASLGDSNGSGQPFDALRSLTGLGEKPKRSEDEDEEGNRS
jgi:capsid portal protein